MSKPDFKELARAAYNSSRKMSATEGTVISAIATCLEQAYEAGRQAGIDSALPSADEFTNNGIKCTTLGTTSMRFMIGCAIT